MFTFDFDVVVIVVVAQRVVAVVVVAEVDVVFRRPLEGVVVGFAVESTVAQAELVARNQLPAACDAPETVHVIYFIPGLHHQIVLFEF